MELIFYNSLITCVIGLAFCLVFAVAHVAHGTDFDEDLGKTFIVMDVIFKVSFYGMFICFIGWVWS